MYLNKHFLSFFLLVFLSFQSFSQQNAPGNVSSGLLTWLDASDVNGDGNLNNEPINNSPLNIWIDKSGQGNNAIKFIGQGRVLSDAISAINSNSVVSLASNSVYNFPSVDIRPNATEDLTIITVYRQKSSGNTGLWGNDNGNWDRFMYTKFDAIAGANNGIASRGPGQNPPYTAIPGSGILNEVYLFTAIYDGNVENGVNNGPVNGSSFFFNGTKLGSFTDKTNSSAQPNLRLGYDGDDGYFNGDVAEIIIYDRVLNGCEIQSINDYLSVKYGKTFSTASISANGPTTFNIGGSVTLTTTAGSGVTYQWKKDGNDISGANVQTFTATESGDYSVEITDDCGTAASAVITVAIIDTTPPTAITKDITVELDENGNASITAEEIDNGSSDDSGEDVIMVIDITSFDCSTIGPNNVTLTVSDINGNESTATATVTVEDNITPAINIPENVTVNTNNDDCGYTFDTHPAATAEDNCAIENVTGTRSDGLALTDLYPVGETIITWSATDVNGNTATSGNITNYTNEIFSDPSRFSDEAVLINFENITEPTITSGYFIDQGVDVSLSNGANIPITSFPLGNPPYGGNLYGKTIHNLSGDLASTNYVAPTIDITFLEGTKRAGFDIVAPFNDKVSLTVQCLKNGNVIDTQIIEVEKQVSQFIGVESEELFDQISVVGKPIEGIVGFTQIFYTYTFVDNIRFERNINLSQVVTVIDNQAPVFTTTETIPVYLDENGVATFNTEDFNADTVTDNCSIESITFDKTIFNCNEVGINVINATATDVNGNITVGPVNIDVKDIIVPTVITKDITIELDGNGNTSITADEINNGSFDTCGIKTISLDNDTFSCSNVGVNVVILTVEDNNGNMASLTANVTVQDNIAPNVITNDITVELDTNGSASITAGDINNGSTDACGILSYELNNSTFNCSNVGLNEVILTVTDNNNNVSTATANVTVNDVTAPNVITKDIVIELDANGSASITTSDINNGSTDACGIDSYSLDNDTFSCSNAGVNTVILTVKDINGNEASLSANVTVQDNIAPTVITQNYSIDLVNGVANITESDIDGGTFDNCGVRLSIDRDNFSCADIGDHVVTLTAIDPSGNTSSNTAIVSILGDVPTIAVNDFNAVQTQKKNTIFLGYGPQSINLSTVVSGGSGYTYEWTTSTGEYVSNEANPSINPTISTTYDVTVTNSNGCTASTSIYVCVIDARAFDKKGRYKGKVTVCHHTNGKKGTKHVMINISPNAVMTHLTKHGVGTDHADKLGACDAVCITNTSARSNSTKDVTISSIEDNLSVYPNPSNGIFDIKLTAVNLQTELYLFDTAGKLIERKSISKENSSENIITMGNYNLASGFYLLRIITKDETITKKLIIEKSK